MLFIQLKGYNANVLPYATSAGAPVIWVMMWYRGSRGIDNVNKELGIKFNELKLQYQKLMEEFEWNELVYSAKFSFEPVIGEIYHLYRDRRINFLSLIGPNGTRSILGL
jgi:hypothetical protein